MPRRPTIAARNARLRLVEMAAEMKGATPFPPLAVLAGQLDVHSSTVFRILRDLSREGVVWQAPNGRFHVPEARRQKMQGLPLCFIGREMSLWSRLYQEILEGVDAACSENQGSLVLCSSPALVRHKAPLEKPRFASLALQKKELAAVLNHIPRKCSGLVLDHLWSPEVVSADALLPVPMVHVMRSGERSGIDFRFGAHLVAKMLSSVRCRGVALVVPFEGDWAISTAARALEESLASWPMEKMEMPEAISRAGCLLQKGYVFVCTEDNAAIRLASLLEPLCQKASFFPLVATQGTGLPSDPITRLRYDFKKLGWVAATSIFDGVSGPLLRPKLLCPMIRES